MYPWWWLQASGAQPSAAQEQAGPSNSRQSVLTSSKQSLPSRSGQPHLRSSRQSAPASSRQSGPSGSSRQPAHSSSRHSGPRSSSRQAADCSLAQPAGEPQKQHQAPPEASCKPAEQGLSASPLKAKQVAVPQQGQPSGQLQPDKVRHAGHLWKTIAMSAQAHMSWHACTLVVSSESDDAGIVYVFARCHDCRFGNDMLVVKIMYRLFNVMKQAVDMHGYGVLQATVCACKVV